MIRHLYWLIPNHARMMATSLTCSRRSPGPPESPGWSPRWGARRRGSGGGVIGGVGRASVAGVACSATCPRSRSAVVSVAMIDVLIYQDLSLIEGSIPMPDDVRRALASVVSVPVTPFDQRGEVDER